MRIPSWFKPGAWGAVIGIAATVIVGFSQMGWRTGSGANALALERSNLAVASALVPFCVAKSQQASASTAMAKFKAESSSWSRADIVRTSGWATLDGMSTPDSALVRACSEQLETMKSS